MHHHLVLASAWRFRRGDTVVEPMLRKVAGDRIVLCSTGGKDWVEPDAVATPTEGGWRVTGRKTFASIAPAANVAVTFAVVGGPAPGNEVIAFGLPLSAEGVRVEETWDSVGMRGTGSHDIVLEDVFVAEGQVSARRTWGLLDRPLLVASAHAWPVVAATYLGVAEGLVELVTGTGRVGSGSDRLVGQLEHAVRTAGWVLDGAIAELGDDPDPTLDTFVTVQHAKRAVALACQEVAAVAPELAGGGAYARRGAVDRMVRDLGGIRFHPYGPEARLVHAGRHRRGLDRVDL
jgi:alkylation response protein AidB-like acyl-CoA dehydrogenase